MRISRWDLGQGETCENFDLQLKDENKFENLEMRLTLRWNKAWEFEDEIYVKVKKDTRILKYDLSANKTLKCNLGLEMWFKSKWKKAWKSQKCKITNYIILWVHNFFISSLIELEGKDVIMKRNNSNDALSFFLNWNCFFSWDMWVSCMK